MTDVDHATPTSLSDVELLMSGARAEVARLSLAVRGARREAELRERDAADLEDRARDAEALLEESLRELVHERRRERASDLAEQRADAERVVAEVREQAGWTAALALKDALARGGAAREVTAQRRTESEVEAEQPRLPTVSAPLRLRVVGGDDLVEPEQDLVFAADEPADDEPARPPAVEAPPGRASHPAGLDSGTVLVPADDLHELVQAAVAVGLRDAIEHAVATMHLVPALARRVAPAAPAAPAAPVAPERRPVPDRVGEVGDERPFLRRLLYLDVVLPLVAALIVLVLFIAWTG